MKKLLLLGVLAFGLALQAQAKPMALYFEGGQNYITDKNNNAVSARDGYIVTYWTAGTSAGPLTITGAASFFADADYGAEAAGYFQSAGWYIDSAAAAPVYVEARIFQYSPGTLIDEAYVNGLSDLSPYLEYWNLIEATGADVSRGVLTFTGTLDKDGDSTGIAFSPATLKLIGTPGTIASGGQVPEPSSYAVLAGLAILAFVAARRARR